MAATSSPLSTGTTVSTAWLIERRSPSAMPRCRGGTWPATATMLSGKPTPAPKPATTANTAKAATDCATDSRPIPSATEAIDTTRVRPVPPSIRVTAGITGRMSTEVSDPTLTRVPMTVADMPISSSITGRNASRTVRARKMPALVRTASWKPTLPRTVRSILPEPTTSRDMSTFMLPTSR